MLRRVLFGAAAVLACSAVVVSADPKDDITAAVQKLADSPNYSWTTTTEGGMNRGPTEGKTQKDGLTTLSMAMRDNTMEVIVQGDKAAVKTADGWKSAAELMSGGDDGGGPPPPERMAAMMARNIRTPATQAKENIDKLTNIQKTDDGYSADLSPDAATQMLSFRRRPTATTATSQPDNAPQMQVSGAKGSVKISIKDGIVSKIVMHLTGTITFNDNTRDVDRTTTTEIKDVGTTKIDVPDEAKAKLNS